MADQPFVLPSDIGQASPAAGAFVLPSDTTPAPTPQTSQSLGFYKGFMHPFDRAALALQGAADAIGIAKPLNALGAKLGMAPSAEAGEQQHEQYIAGQEKGGVVPGKIGEFAGNVVGTLPLAGLGPVAGGAVAGGLLSDSGSTGGTVADMLMGAAGGKAGDLVAKGLSAVAKPVVKAIANKVQDWTSPLAGAARDAGQYVYGLMGDNAPADIKAAADATPGKPLMAAEAIGRAGTTALAAVGRRAGTTADLLAGQLQERAAAAPDRILGDYATAAGIDPAAARGDMDAFLQNGRAAAAPLFEKALASPKGVWNPDLVALSQRPVIQKALSQSYDDILNAGKDPAGFGFTAKDPDTGKFVRAPRPTAEAWDLVKKNVSGQLERDPFGKVIPDSISRGNYNVGVAGRDLTATLRDAIPGYGDALDRSGDYLTINKAFQDGQNFILNPNVTAAQLADRVAKLSPAEVQAFKGGIANKLFDKAQLKSFGATMFDAPLVRQKLAAALGPDNAAKFLENMKIEKGMKAVGARINPDTGSITSNILNATSEQDEAKQKAIVDAIYAGAHLATGNKLGAWMRMLSAAQRLGGGPSSRMPEATRNEVGRLLLMSPDDLANHLSSLDRTFNPPAVRQISGAINAARPAIRAGAAALAPRVGPRVFITGPDTDQETSQ